MPIMPANFVPYEMKSSVIEITSYQDKNLTGVLKNTFFEKPVAFGGTMQLLLLIDSLHDDIGFPSENMSPRSFGTSMQHEKLKLTAPKEEAKAIATLKIQVLFRQNASWQGRIIWTEKELETQFRSALELLMLIDSIMTQQ